MLIKIRAATVTMGDCEARAMRFPLWIRLAVRLYLGIWRPKAIMGMEFAGEVEAVGGQVRRFKPGDAVLGNGGLTFGGYAEYTCQPEDGLLVKKPANISFEEAAAVTTGALNAFHFLRLAQLEPGMRILIIGAAGTIGTYAVQIARQAGAEVTAIDRGDKLAMLQSIGAQQVIDYTQGDFTRSDERYDVIFDVICAGSFLRTLGLLKPGGVYLVGNPRVKHMLLGRWVRLISGKRVVSNPAAERVEDLVHLAGMIEAGKLRPVIDRTYPLEQIVEAHHYVDSGSKQGNVAITVQ